MRSGVSLAAAGSGKGYFVAVVVGVVAVLAVVAVVVAVACSM